MSTLDRARERAPLELWRADLDAHAERAALLQAICARDELRRADQFPDLLRRGRFIARRALLRILLGDAAQRSGSDRELRAQTAHAGADCLFAIGTTRSLGLGLAPVRAPLRVPRGLLRPEEALRVAGSEDPPRTLAAWVAAREALRRAGRSDVWGSLSDRIGPAFDGPTSFFEDAELSMQLVSLQDAVGCIVHDGQPDTIPTRELGGG